MQEVDNKKTMTMTAQAMAAKYGIKIVFGGGEGLRTEYDDNARPIAIHLPELPKKEFTDDVLTIFRGGIDHEAGHVRFTDMKKFDALSKHPSEIKQVQARIANIFEDNYVERKMAELYQGCGTNLKNLAIYQFGKHRNMQDMEKIEEETNIFNNIYSWMLRYARCSLYQCHELWEGLQPYRQWMKKNAPTLKQALERLMDNALPKVRGTADNIDIAEKAYDLVLQWAQDNLPPPPPQQSNGDGDEKKEQEQQGQQQSMGGGDQSGEGQQTPAQGENAGQGQGQLGQDDQSGDDQQEDDGEGDGEGQPDDQDDQGQDGQDNSGQGKGGGQGNGQGSPSDMEDSGQDGKSGDGSGNGDSGDAAGRRPTSFMENASQSKVYHLLNSADALKDMLKREDKLQDSGQLANEELREHIQDGSLYSAAMNVSGFEFRDLDDKYIFEAEATSSMLDTQLRGLMQHYVYNYGGSATSGRRIDMHKLHRLASGNTRIFKRTVEKQGINTEVVFVVDTSGSMYSHNRITIASQCLYAAMLSLRKIPGIRSSAVWFSDDCGDIYLADKPVKPVMLDHMGGTMAGTGLIYARSKMDWSVQMRRVMILLTDGETYAEEDVKDIVHEMLDKGINIYAIGIQTKDYALNPYMPANRYRLIEDLKEFPSMLFALLREGLLKNIGVQI